MFAGLLALAVGLPFAAAALVLMFGRRFGTRTGLLVAAVAASVFFGCLYLVPAAIAGNPVVFDTEWMPALGARFALRADPFGLFFALLISGIGTLIAIYSIAYMPTLEPRRAAQYYATLLAFMGAMLGVALADDLVVLFVFWEITSLTSFLLVGFWYEQEAAGKAALTALQITALGGMVMMAGIVLIGVTCGTFSISAIAGDETVRSTLVSSPAFSIALLLVLAGALTKSAQWPFHFWLPGAMVAPTPISAYLHAATMVKAGVFLLGRVAPIFSVSPLWFWILVPIGLGTFLLGGLQALRSTDLKAMLANSTVATLGVFTLSYGLGSSAQDAFQMLSHATYKGSLFLTAGIVEHAVHTRDIRNIAGLRERMPITFSICLLAALSMAGVWPTLGYQAKELAYAGLSSLEAMAPFWRWLLLATAVMGNALLVAVALTLVVRLFLGEPSAAADKAHDPSATLWMPAALLAAIGFGAGLFPRATGEWAAAFSSRDGARLDLHLVPTGAGFLLALLTYGAGIAIYRARGVITKIPPLRTTMQQAWDALLDGVTRVAVAFSDRWQNGSVYWYFSGTLIFTVGLVAYALYGHAISLGSVSIDLGEMQWYGLALCAMLAVTAIMVVRFTTRVAAAIALTANGFLTALLFVVYRSPDILLTQILIETVSTIFILLILYFMPPFRAERVTTIRRALNWTISAAVGMVMFVLLLLCTSPEFRETNNLALDYLTRSKAEAGGANAVNVIIVDLRAMDTNGEIAVLMMVGLLVFGLLRSRRSDSATSCNSAATLGGGGDSPILRVVARIAVPLTLLVSLVIFMQGHNLPGGGFVAGVMAAAAGATYLLAFGVSQAARLPWWRVSVVGLLISVATGTVPFLLGRWYMDHEILHFPLPLIGEYELPTATFFDLGVYMIVLGTIMTIFVELGQEEA